MGSALRQYRNTRIALRNCLDAGVKIRVSNQQRGREEGKGDFGVVVLFGEDEGGDDEGDVWRLK